MERIKVLLNAWALCIGVGTGPASPVLAGPLFRTIKP